MDRAPRDADPDGWATMDARAANAARELGAFDDAAARIERLTRALPSGDEEERAGFTSYLSKLAELVAARNAASEPIAMVPERVAARACAHGATHRRCGEEGVRELVEQIRRAEAD